MYTIPESDYVTLDSVGDWDGNEETAAYQFNTILILVANTLPDSDSDRFNEVKSQLWDVVGSDIELLIYTTKVMKHIIKEHIT